MRMAGQSGQTSTEYMLVVSVVVVAVVAGAYTFVPAFNNGVRSLADDVERILGGDGIGGQGGRNAAGDTMSGQGGGEAPSSGDRGPSISMDGLDQVADNGNNPFNYILKDLGKDLGKDLLPIFDQGTQVAVAPTDSPSGDAVVIAIAPIRAGPPSS